VDYLLNGDEDSFREGIFNIESQWAQCFLKEHLTLGMRSSQRGESANRVVKQNLPSRAYLMEPFRATFAMERRQQHRISESCNDGEFQASSCAAAWSNKVNLRKHVNVYCAERMLIQEGLSRDGYRFKQVPGGDVAKNYAYDLTLTIPGDSVGSWTADDASALLAALTSVYNDATLQFVIKSSSDVGGVLQLVVQVIGFHQQDLANDSYALIAGGGLRFSGRFASVATTASEPVKGCASGLSVHSGSSAEVRTYDVFLKQGDHYEVIFSWSNGQFASGTCSCSHFRQYEMVCRHQIFLFAALRINTTYSVFFKVINNKRWSRQCLVEMANLHLADLKEDTVGEELTPAALDLDSSESAPVHYTFDAEARRTELGTVLRDLHKSCVQIMTQSDFARLMKHLKEINLLANLMHRNFEKTNSDQVITWRIFSSLNSSCLRRLQKVVPLLHPLKTLIT